MTAQSDGNGNMQEMPEGDMPPVHDLSRPRIVDHVPAIPDEERAVVERGLTAFMKVADERDDWRKKYEEQLLENERLKIQIESAREGERLHVQKIVDEAVLEGKKAETEISILRDEMMHLRRDLSLAQGALADRTAQNAKLSARLAVIAAAMEQVMTENNDDGE